MFAQNNKVIENEWKRGGKINFVLVLLVGMTFGEVQI